MFAVLRCKPSYLFRLLTVVCSASLWILTDFFHYLLVICSAIHLVPVKVSAVLDRGALTLNLCALVMILSLAAGGQEKLMDINHLYGIFCFRGKTGLK